MHEHLVCVKVFSSLFNAPVCSCTDRALCATPMAWREKIYKLEYMIKIIATPEILWLMLNHNCHILSFNSGLIFWTVSNVCNASHAQLLIMDLYSPGLILLNNYL